MIENPEKMPANGLPNMSEMQQAAFEENLKNIEAARAEKAYAGAVGFHGWKPEWLTHLDGIGQLIDVLNAKGVKSFTMHGMTIEMDPRSAAIAKALEAERQNMHANGGDDPDEKKPGHEAQAARKKAKTPSNDELLKDPYVGLNINQ